MGAASDCQMATRYNFAKATTRKNKSGQTHAQNHKKQKEVYNRRLPPINSAVKDTTPSSETAAHTGVDFQSEYVFLDGDESVQRSDEDEYVWVP